MTSTISSSAPDPLGRRSRPVLHERIRTVVPDEARRIVTEYFYPHYLEAPSRKIDAEVAFVRSGPITLSRITYGTEITLGSDALETAYQVNIALTGQVNSYCGPQSGLTRGHVATILNPSGRIKLEQWSGDGYVFGVRLDRAFVENELTALLGRAVVRPLAFGIDLDLAGDRHSLVKGVLSTLTTTLNRAPDTFTPTALTTMASALVSGLLATHANSYEELFVSEPAGRERTAVDLAVEAMLSAPHRPWTAAELAAVANGVSVRSLQYSFRKMRDETMFAFLKNVRLDEARRLLVTADVSVRTAASQSGITHFSRFAAEYRRRFGENPSETLAARGGGPRDTAPDG